MPIRFLVNIVHAFHDVEHLYLALEFMPGGDLRHYMTKQEMLTEKETRKLGVDVGFIIACTVLGLEYMHRKGVIHRDIKPENLVIDDYGYVRITDLGIARMITEDNTGENAGTLGYMSPEVMFKKDHGVAVDYFALGVLGYEAMMGKVM